MKNKFLWVVLLLAVTACTGLSTEASPPAVTPSLTATPSPTRSPTMTPTPTLTPTVTITFTPTVTPEVPFEFVITGDTGGNVGPGEFDTPQYFRGACEAILNLTPGAFMITPGDTHPVADTRWTIDQVLGSEYLWFPVVGNHELLEPEDMAWLRAFQPDIIGDIRRGPDACPETTYSFDYGNAHFVILNVYCREDGDTITDGAITDEIYYWLEEDLAETGKEHIFVIGHEPAFPQPDASAGIIRHEDDSLNKYPVTRDRFWALLKVRGVRAYINGHTHSYSVVKIDGVWQVDIGHTNGAWTQATTSTFMIIHVNEGVVSYETYRTTLTDGTYVLKFSGILD